MEYKRILVVTPGIMVQVGDIRTRTPASFVVEKFRVPAIEGYLKTMGAQYIIELATEKDLPKKRIKKNSGMKKILSGDLKSGLNLKLNI